MCKVKIPQEDSDKVLAVGHKVMYQGKEAVIIGIRVWHDKGTLLGPPQRHRAVFDLQGEGWSTVNTGIDEIDLWHEVPPLPTAPPHP